MSDSPPSLDAARFFEGRARSYDAAYDARDLDGHSLRARLAAVERLAGAGPGEALDAGMGPGRLCAILGRLGWRVTGVDAAPEMLAVARARVPQAAGRMYVAAIEALPFPDASFDLVTATGVLEYVDLHAALGEIARVVRPTGHVVVSYPNPHAIYGVWKSRLWYPLVRIAKRALRMRNADLPRGAGAVGPSRFLVAMHDAGLEPGPYVHSSYLLSLTPLERLLPRATLGLSERFEANASRRWAGLLATQVVYRARARPNEPHEPP